MTEEIIKELKGIACNLMIRSANLQKYSTIYYYNVDWAINDVNDEVEKIAECVEEWKQVWKKMTDNLNKEEEISEMNEKKETEKVADDLNKFYDGVSEANCIPNEVKEVV